MRRLGSLLCLLAIGGCAPPSHQPQSPHQEADDISQKARAAAPLPDDPPLAWNSETHSPNPGEVPDDLRHLQAICGEWDERLSGVAAWLARRGSVGGYGNDVDHLTFALRAAGTPYVWPAAWSLASEEVENEGELSQALSRWLARLEPGDLRRCGLIRVAQPTRNIVVAVVSTALADLVVPLPTRARVGQWLDFRADLRVEASQAKLILLPPTGEPMSVPTQQAGSQVRARFAAASPGPWLIQLLASGDTGPRPMLEAMLFVDVPPSAAFRDLPVPGESSTGRGETAAFALDRMVTEMRRETGRPVLRRDPTLDAIAQRHAQSMERWRRIGHDVGDGPTHERLTAANFRTRLAGENVAHASDATRVHRALWASPSHRSNLLHRGFTRWGLGVVEDTDGSLWVCQLFASEN